MPAHATTVGDQVVDVEALGRQSLRCEAGFPCRRVGLLWLGATISQGDVTETARHDSTQATGSGIERAVQEGLADDRGKASTVGDTAPGAGHVLDYSPQAAQCRSHVVDATATVL